MEIIRGKQPGAKKVVIYGPEGIGKSTFASRFPDPVFIDTEGSTKDMDVARTPAPSSWQMLLEQVRYFISHPNMLKTLVIDTADWAEQMCSAAVCAQYRKGGIEEFGYGKGYTYLQEEFGKLLNLLTELVEQKGIHVVLTAHAKMRKFEQPDELGAYDRWEMKLTKQVAPMVKEWADMVLFANYKTMVINVDGQGAQKGKNKVQGGRRVMYTTHHSCWDAKNRYGLPEEVDFDFSAIAHIFSGQPAPAPKPPAAAPAVLPQANGTQMEMSFGLVKDSYREAQQTAPADARPVTAASGEPAEQEAMKPPEDKPVSLDSRIPKALRDLMEANKVSMGDMEEAVARKGYVPLGTPIWDFDKVNPGIVEGLLVPCWDQVYEMIKGLWENTEIPF